MMRAFYSVVAAFAVSQTAYAADPSVAMCRVQFQNDSTEYNKQELLSCLNKVDKTNLKFLHVTATATPPGSTNYNTSLSEQRADILRRDLQQEFPNIEIVTGPGGENSATGRSGEVLAVEFGDAMAAPGATTADTAAPTDTMASPTTNQPQSLSVTTVTTTLRSPGEQAVRVAARLGRDRYYPAGGPNENFIAGGLDLAWIPSALSLNMGSMARAELGVTGSVMNSTDLVNAASVHAFAGPGLRYNDVVLGARALIGGVWDSSRKWRGDGGGEIRIGYEGSDLSVFAGLGATTRITRVGLDLGVLL